MEWLDLRGEMLEQQGCTKDPRHTKMPRRVARLSPSDVRAAKAGGALRHHRALKLPARKTIAEELIGEFATIDGNANRNLDPGDPTTRTASRW